MRRLGKVRPVCIDSLPAFLDNVCWLFGHSTVWPSGRHLYCGFRDLPKYISFATCVAILSIAHPTLFTPEAKAKESCKPAIVGTGTVASVRDGRTVLLTDGREVRLTAIEVVDSRDALRSLVDGRELQLMRLETRIDMDARSRSFASEMLNNQSRKCW
jgi:hypothetical protein